MRRVVVALVIFISAIPVLAQEPATTTDTITRARQGPGYTFPLAYEILPGSQVSLVEQTPDSAWFLTQSGVWIPADALENSPADALPVVQDLPPVPETNVAQCVSVVGDSVPYGSVVYIVPGHGFAILRTTPFALVLEDAFAARGLSHIEVRDRSAEAAFLSDLGKNPYKEMEAYDRLLDDGCRLTVIMPWINDLSVLRDDNVNAHLDDLVNLVQTLHQFSDGQIVVLGFYHGQPSDFAREHAPGFLPENIDAANEALFAACQPDGVLADATCMETDSLFAEMDNAHVLLEATQQEVDDLLYEPIPDDVAPFFEVFWRDNPDGEVIGDGVHLSDVGKKILAQAIVDEMLSIDPDL